MEDFGADGLGDCSFQWAGEGESLGSGHEVERERATGGPGFVDDDVFGGPQIEPAGFDVADDSFGSWLPLRA